MINSERQPVDKYGGRVRSVTGDGELPVTEPFVRQVVEKIQGVIEAKLNPAQPPPVTTIHLAYPGLSYQASPYHPGLYPTMSPPQVAYANPTVSQPGNSTSWNIDPREVHILIGSVGLVVPPSICLQLVLVRGGVVV